MYICMYTYILNTCTGINAWVCIWSEPCNFASAALYTYVYTTVRVCIALCESVTNTLHKIQRTQTQHTHNTHTRRVRDLPNAEEGVRKERHVKMQRDRDTYAHTTHTHKPEGGRGHAKEGIHREREEERDRDTYTQTAHTHLKGAGDCDAEEGL